MSAADPAGGETLPQLLLSRWGSDAVALQFPDGAGTVTLTAGEMAAIVTRIAAGLIALGVEPGERVAVMGLTSASWTLVDCGALLAQAVVVPIYHTNSAEECAYVLEDSGARIVFCDSRARADVIAAAETGATPRQVILFGPEVEAVREGELTLPVLEGLGSEEDRARAAERAGRIRAADLATLVYTSGTSGPPKGCMLSHANFMAASRAYAEQLGLGPQHSLYQFLPLAHVLARVAQVAALAAGARIIYWSGDMARIPEDLRRSAPTHFPAVPRVFEKIHAQVLAQLDDASALGRRTFDWALRIGRRHSRAQRAGQRPSRMLALQHRLADRLVLARIRAVFGPRLELALVGAAPIARDLLEFFDACGVTVLEGYGLTETTAAATLNTQQARRLGSVGRPLPGVAVRTGDDGEILIRGPEVFLGYWGKPAATAATVDETGWLHTGDLGTLSSDGFLTITGRKKDLIITSSGKNIAPQNIESELRESRFLSEAVLYGDNRPYLVALLALDAEEARSLWREGSPPSSGSELAAAPEVRAAIEQAVSAVNARLAAIEQVKRYAVLDHALTQSGGEMTPTMKVRRASVYAKYAELLDELYAGDVA